MTDDTQRHHALGHNPNFARPCVALLNRAFVNARYSPHDEIADEEPAWLVERVSALQDGVAMIGSERLAILGSDRSVT